MKMLRRRGIKKMLQKTSPAKCRLKWIGSKHNSSRLKQRAIILSLKLSIIVAKYIIFPLSHVFHKATGFSVSFEMAGAVSESWCYLESHFLTSEHRIYKKNSETKLQWYSPFEEVVRLKNVWILLTERLYTRWHVIEQNVTYNDSVGSILTFFNLGDVTLATSVGGKKSWLQQNNGFLKLPNSIYRR